MVWGAESRREFTFLRRNFGGVCGVAVGDQRWSSLLRQIDSEQANFRVARHSGTISPSS